MPDSRNTTKALEVFDVVTAQELSVVEVVRYRVVAGSFDEAKALVKAGKARNFELNDSEKPIWGPRGFGRSLDEAMGEI